MGTDTAVAYTAKGPGRVCWMGVTKYKEPGPSDDKITHQSSENNIDHL